MSTARPDFHTVASTVAAAERIVATLRPYLQADASGGDRQIDRVAVIERHAGQFDKASEVKGWLSTRDGGIRIAALRISAMHNEGSRLIGTVRWAAYVFVTDQYGYARDQRAEVIAGRLCKALMLKSGWVDSGASSRPDAVQADNLYNGEIDKLGVAIWAVTWSQDWPLDEPIDMATLDDFLRCGVGLELADGAPIAEAEITLPGPNGASA